ncbi:hypothetical protein Ancab_002970 [Ancistrocladus abbreviatus]
MKITVFSNHMKIRGELTLSTLIRSFKSGLEILSNVRLISASGANVPAAGVLGFASLIFVLRNGKMGNFSSLLWSSERHGSSDKLFVPGLRNLGNNCFLNVILQALASCKSFRNFLEENNEKLQSSSLQEEVENSSLSVALASLLEDLCTLQDRGTVLSPWKVMSAMEFYIPQFKMTSQQDAAEAFLHLLSCLREEFSESYVPKYRTLADVDAPSARFINPKGEDMNEPERWRRLFFGPFDGIISSFLTCRSCCSEIMMDFELFHTLPLSPVGNDCASIVDGCTLEDCINRLMNAERVENYYCSHCWHVAAIKYLSSDEGHTKEREKLSGCNEQDSCDCRNLTCLQTLPWSNGFSQAFKHLSIARCPKILCLHLQRVSVNIFGEPIKIQDHVSFPLILDLSPYLKNGFGAENQKENVQRKQAIQQHQLSLSHPNRNGMISDGKKLTLVKELAGLESFDKCMLAFQKLGLPLAQTSCYANPMYIQSSHDKVECHSAASDGHMYHLVSVVEHFGRAGSGHYTVYRGVGTEVDSGNDGGKINTPQLQWFCISDAEVNPASFRRIPEIQ